RRARADHGTARRQSAVRAREPAGTPEMKPGRDRLGPAAARPGLISTTPVVCLVLVSALLALAVLVPTPAFAAPAPVAMIDIDGVINAVTLRLVGLAIDRAQAEHAQALIIKLDTPGGLERSMRGIVQRMLNAEVPIVVYVAPTGARAASAGVFITEAAHVAAMAPATNIGAAHPVALSGGVDKESMNKIEN